MSDGVLNSSFSTPMPWDLHLNFYSEMIKRKFLNAGQKVRIKFYSKVLADVRQILEDL